MSVRLGLLALLDQADMYGYQLKTRFEAQTGGIWLLNIGQVYSTLERLERDGLVTTTQPPGASGRSGSSGSSTDPDASGRSGRSGGREQKYYAITRAGRDELAGWFAAGLPDAPPPRDELVAKVLFALAGGRDHALAVITRQRTALTAALQSRRRAQRASRDEDDGRQGRVAGGAGDADHATGASASSASGAAPSSSPAANGVAALSTQLVTDALVARAEADLRWLDLCEARVRLLASGATAATGATGPADATGPTST